MKEDTIIINNYPMSLLTPSPLRAIFFLKSKQINSFNFNEVVVIVFIYRSLSLCPWLSQEYFFMHVLIILLKTSFQIN